MAARSCSSSSSCARKFPSDATRSAGTRSTNEHEQAQIARTGSSRMKHLRKIIVAAFAVTFGLAAAGAADLPPIKIGIVYSYTGSSADAGPVLDAAVAAWLAQHHGMMSGRKVELIKRDDTGPAPDVA